MEHIICLKTRRITRTSKRFNYKKKGFGPLSFLFIFYINCNKVVKVGKFTYSQNFIMEEENVR